MQTAPGKTETPSGKTLNEQKTAPKARNDLLPAFNVGMVLLAALVPAFNPVRKVSTRQVGRVARSIQRFGFRVPPILGKNLEIIDGQAGVEAARRLGLTEIPCIITDDLSAEDVRMRRIALNRIQECGEWVSGAPTPPSASCRDLRFSPCSVFGWEVLHGALSGGSQSD